MRGRARPVRVAVVGADFGWLGRALWRACRDRGADILTLSVQSPYGPRQPLPTDLPTEEVRPLWPLRRLGRLWWIDPRLGQVVRRLRPDIIHVLSEPWAIAVMHSLRLARRLDVPLSVHGADNLYRHGYWVEQMIRGRVLRHVLPRLAGFTSWNHAGVELARAHGLPAWVPTAVAPAVVPDPAAFRPPSPDERRELRANFGLPNDGPVVGFAGRLVPEKGVMDAVAAVRALPEAPFFTVWGTGPLERRVREGLRDVRGSYGGHLSYPRIPEALRACDILVVPSRRASDWAEQFGRVAVEGMLSGCAVVAYRSGALPEVVSEGGILLDEGDVEGLSRAIGDLAGDPDRRRRVAERGLASVRRRYAPHVLAEHMLALWDAMVGR